MLGEMAGNAAVAALIEAAKNVARRRHHVVVRAPHVLDVLFSSPGMARRVRKMGIDADHLRESAAAVLDGLPPVTGYRDGAQPELCPSVSLAVDRAAPHIAQYGTVELVSAMVDAPELRSAFRPYVLDESLVEELRRGAPGRDIADAMTWLLANNLDLAERLVDGGLDLADLTTRCGHSFRDVLPEAIDAARSAGAARVDAATLMAFLTRDIAHVAGYEPRAIGDALEELIHGPHLVEDVAEDEPAEIVFVNDPMTAFSTVQAILTAHFGMSELEAYDVALAIDAREGAVVGRASGGKARDLAELARRDARREGYPLRVVVRARA